MRSLDARLAAGAVTVSYKKKRKGKKSDPDKERRKELKKHRKKEAAYDIRDKKHRLPFKEGDDEPVLPFSVAV